MQVEKRSGESNSNIFPVDPSSLMEDNPAALIVNKESYGRMQANFSPDQFDYPQVVRVATYTSKGIMLRNFVLDGHTRTKYVNDHKVELEETYPTFQFMVRDVTDAVLQNPLIVENPKLARDERALTMLEYLRAVVPPTIEHSQIAPDRIAAHLINAWGNMVGEDLAQKYSAMAALSLLGNQAINFATDEGLLKDLTKQPRMFTGETMEERMLLQQSLRDMASIIRQSKLHRSEVARSAFFLVSSESIVIGGTTEAQKQLWGLLHSPVVEQKLHDAYIAAGEREQVRDELGSFLHESFRHAATRPNPEEAVSVIVEVIQDPNLSLKQVVTILEDENPISRYDSARIEANLYKLVEGYHSAYRLQGLSEHEELMLQQLGNRTILSQPEMLSIIKNVRAFDKTLQEAYAFTQQHTTKRQSFIAGGVSPQLLNEANTEIQTAIEFVRQSTNLSALTKRQQELTTKIQEYTRKIQVQSNIHELRLKIDDVYDRSLVSAVGEQKRDDIVGLLLGEFSGIDDRNNHVVETRINELISLDPDLFTKVKIGDIRLPSALQKQRERNSRKSDPPRQEVVFPQSPEVKVEPQRQKYSSPLSRVNIITPEEREARRIEMSHTRLAQLCLEIEHQLENIDLEPSDLTDVERERLQNIVNRLGALGFDHPNVKEVMLKHYPRLQQIVGQVQGQKIVNDQADRD